VKKTSNLQQKYFFTFNFPPPFVLVFILLRQYYLLDYKISNSRSCIIVKLYDQNFGMIILELKIIDYYYLLVAREQFVNANTTI